MASSMGSRNTSARSAPPSVRPLPAGRGRALVRLVGRATLLALAALVALPTTMRGQLRPDADWRTLATPHFRVHFTPRTEPFARRAAASAERAYDQLARELVTPRGVIDLVISDDVDFSNGYATSYPTNRIVVYVHPPVDLLALRNYGDWGTLVVTHELVHIFHLDRARGAWGALQRLFGRNPLFFPAFYEPGWLAEGLAVYYESRLTGGGRVEGSAHRAIARAAALQGDVLRLQDASGARSRFPGGGVSYVYGGLVFDELARTRGAETVSAFVERSSGQLVPFFLNRAAKASFGVTFDEAWRGVRDSALAAGRGLGVPLPGWRARSSHWDDLGYPRWRDSSLVVLGSTGRETAGAYEIAPSGRPRRLGRRIAGEGNVPLAGGGLLFAQLEYESPYTVRSDLYVQQDGETRRLTRGERLAQPDAREDGEIVAVRTEAGTTVLVRLAPDGTRLRAITFASPDTQWTEPRWSSAGDRIAAVRIIAGGRSQIVTLAPDGGDVVVVVDETGSVSASPSWTADGSRLFFTSDRSGTREVYSVEATAAMSEPRAAIRLSATPTELRFPEPGATLAAIELRGDGYVLGTAPLPATGAPPADTAPVTRLEGRRALLSAPAPVGAPARGYSAWRSLLPHYWFPVVYEGTGETRLGALTSGEDVLGRHAYYVEGWAGTRGIERGGLLSYEWRGLGTPVVDLVVSQGWDPIPIVDSSGSPIGTLRRRSRVATAALSWQRLRARNAAVLRAGVELEARDYAADSDELLAALGPFFSRVRTLPALFATASASNTQRPTRSISPEDGVAGYVQGERRWERGVPGSAYARLTGALSGYKSLDLPGFAHHVLALRVAGGWSDSPDGTELSVGGMSSEAVAVAGTTLGGRRQFPVRGYERGSLAGTRAVAVAAEYRAPAFMPARGLKLLPLYLDRTSLTLFGDGAVAWCGERLVRGGVCGSGATPGSPLASVGAELVAEAAFPYDLPLQLRIGYAKPVGRVPPGKRASGIYGAFGLSF